MSKFDKTIKRIVVKLGSTQIVDGNFKPKAGQLAALAKQIKMLRKAGIEVILVSSGAIALGMGELKEHKRPTDLASLQARAALGQAVLMRVYSEAFKKAQLKCAQVLLVWDDFQNRALNVRHTLEAILKEGVVPIINENDTTSTEEIKFGDNDKLSALVAKFLHADCLIILSSVDGFYGRDKEVIRNIPAITPAIISMSAGTSHVHVAKGGMITKIDAIQVATKAGIPCVITAGSAPNVLVRLVQGEQVGTYFNAKG